MLIPRPLEEELYKNLRFKLLTQVEADNKVDLQPYLDPHKIPTIGIGMNFRDESVCNAVMDVLLGSQDSLNSEESIEIEDSYRKRIRAVAISSYSDGEDGKLRSDLDAIMQERFGDNRINLPNKKDSFAFDDVAEVKRVFESIAQTYEDKIDTGLGSKIPNSYERLALFSLAYNQVDSKPLLGPGLIAAMKINNRALAFYQIRYQSNGDHLPGTPTRRYYESEIFGLYDNPASISLEEARLVISMYSVNRRTIAAYDAQHGAKVKTANTRFKPPIVEVTSTKDLLKPANVIFCAANLLNPLDFDTVLLNPLGTIEESGRVLIFGDRNIHNSYSFPTKVVGTNLIIDADNDGEVIFGSSAIGLAQPQTDSSGQRTGANAWLTPNNPGFSLSKSGSNLVITKAPRSTSSITIRDFPFKVKSSNRRLESSDRVEVLSDDDQTQVTGSAYGISLAEVPELDHDVDGNVVSKLGYDSSRKALPNSASLYSDQFIKTPDGLGFFGLIAYGLPIATGTPYDYVRLANFDSKGNLLSEHDLSDETVLVGRQTHTDFYKYTDASGKDSYIYPFDVWHMDESNAQYSKVGFCVVNEEGQITTSKIIASGMYCLPGNPCYSPEEGLVHKEVFSSARVLKAPDSDYVYIAYNKNVFLEGSYTLEQKVNPLTFDNIGEPAPTADCCVTHALTSIPPLSFADGNQIAFDTISGGRANPTFTLQTPKRRALTDLETIPNYSCEDGNQQTNPNLKKAILSLDPDSSVNLSILENPNSVLAVMGRDANSNVHLELPVSDFEEVEIRSIKDSECSVDSILSLDCQALSSAGRRALDVASGNYTDDNFNYYYAGFNSSDYGSDYYTISDDLESTALMLPNSQTVVLVGVNGTEVVKNHQAFFSVQDLSTELPTSLPTTQPTSQPSRQPFADPSAIPSYKPQAIPSFKPTTQPSSQPSTQPTIQDTANPSSQPTIEPSKQLTSNPTTQPSSNPTSIPTKSTKNPSSKPTHHPIAGDLATNPTSQPSGNPSLRPSQSPSFKTQAIPTFNPTKKPAEEIRSEIPTTAPTENLRTTRPAIGNPVTAIPTVQPTNIQTGSVTKYPTPFPSLQNIQQLPQGANSSPNFMETPGGIAVAVAGALLLTAAGLRWIFRKGAPQVNPENAHATPVAQQYEVEANR